MAKVAVECDGSKFHDAAKDAARDAELLSMGWSVYRIPGWRCNAVVPYPKDRYEMDDEDWYAYEREKDERTSRGIPKQVASHFTSDIAEIGRASCRERVCQYV